MIGNWICSWRARIINCVNSMKLNDFSIFDGSHIAEFVWAIKWVHALCLMPFDIHLLFMWKINNECWGEKSSCTRKSKYNSATKCFDFILDICCDEWFVSMDLYIWVYLCRWRCNWAASMEWSNEKSMCEETRRLATALLATASAMLQNIHSNYKSYFTQNSLFFNIKFYSFF